MSKVLNMHSFFDDFEAETKKLKFRNKESGIIRLFTINQMVYEINSARSRNWKDFNRKDWLEGMEKWTEWELVK